MLIEMTYVRKQRWNLEVNEHPSVIGGSLGASSPNLVPHFIKMDSMYIVCFFVHCIYALWYTIAFPYKEKQVSASLDWVAFPSEFLST